MSKRWECTIVGHHYVRYRYPSADTGDAYILKCLRCGHEHELVSLPNIASNLGG